MPDARRHHSVPQFLLAGFAKAKKSVLQTRVLDKKDSKVFLASIRDVMVERDFHSIKMESGVVSLEGFISQIEAVAAPVIKKLIATETTTGLSGEERDTLAIFVALQLVRGTGHRAQFLHLAKEFKKVLEKRGFPVDDKIFAIPNIGTIKLEALHTIANSLPRYAEHLRNKNMIIFKAAAGHEFIIGDNPVTMDNHRERGFWGNIGLAVPGIQIYLPISSKLTLGMWCGDLVGEVQEIIDDVLIKKKHIETMALLGAGTAAQQAKKAVDELNSKMAPAVQLRKEVMAGGPVTTHPENMDRFNSMQVVYAERYLASANGNFDLAKRMLSEHPDMRGGGARGAVQ